MSIVRLIFRSLRYYWRGQLGVVLAAAVSASVLIGALVVGDSVRHSLRRLSLDRLGTADIAVVSGDRFFRATLAAQLATNHLRAAALLHTAGIAIADGGRQRANGVQVYGIDETFRVIAPDFPTPLSTNASSAILNRALASRLGLEVGDSILLRLENTDALPAEIPFLSATDTAPTLRATVTAIATAPQQGDLSVRVSQVAPLNVFVPRDLLGAALEQRGRANLLLVGGSPEAPVDGVAIDRALGTHWTLADGGLMLQERPAAQVFELTSERVFISPKVCQAVLEVVPDPARILTYFVNGIAREDTRIPYSFVSAPGAPLVPEDLGDEEIILNRWAAENLEAAQGDTVRLTYYVVGRLRALEERATTFTVRDIVDIPADGMHRSLTPEFPGLSDSENCRDWDASLPIDLDQIRDEDEAYWDRHGATPKAFVTLAAAQAMWQNPYGRLTAIRIPAEGRMQDDLRRTLQSTITPTVLGVRTIPIREQALAAAANSTDFGGLFIGLSFFLIVAALLLTGMLFVWAVASRASETGLLLALGYRRSQVKRLLFGEGIILALAGSSIGILGGTLYSRLILSALGTVWRGAVGTRVLEICLRPGTLAAGFMASLLVAAACLGIALSRQVRRGIADLQARGASYDALSRKAIGMRLGLACVTLGGAAAIIAWVPAGGGMQAAGAFFGAGALLLAGCIALCDSGLSFVSRGHAGHGLSMAGLAIRSCARQRLRSLTVVAILASGVFMVIAVAANRHDPLHGGNQKSSGTGGFTLYGEATVPVVEDLTTARGRDLLGLGGLDLTHTVIAQIPAHAGDDASCLNLNRVRHPRLLGVSPELFDRRGSFTFTAAPKGQSTEQPWTRLLATTTGHADIVHGVADQSVLTWGLGKTLGDTIEYTDEYGQPFKVKLVGGLANSIFQGSVLINRQDFRARFPSEGGTRVVLLDNERERTDSLREDLTAALEDYGVDWRRADDRLAAFSVIEHTYLSIFLILGGLGLILGTAGLGVVVLRNVMERRRELAMLRAMGYAKGEIMRLLMWEHGVLLLAGLAAGVGAGLVAVMPALATAGAQAPVGLLVGLITAILVNGVLWIRIAVQRAVSGPLLAALRDE